MNSFEYYKKKFKRLQNSQPIGFDEKNFFLFHPTKGLTKFEIKEIYNTKNLYYVITQNEYFIEINLKMNLSMASYILNSCQKIYIEKYEIMNKRFIGIYNIGQNYFILFGNEKIGTILKIENDFIYFEYKSKFYKIKAIISLIKPLSQNNKVNIQYDIDNNVGITDKSGFTIYYTNYSKYEKEGRTYIKIENDLYKIYNKEIIILTLCLNLFQY